MESLIKLEYVDYEIINMLMLYVLALTFRPKEKSTLEISTSPSATGLGIGSIKSKKCITTTPKKRPFYRGSGGAPKSTLLLASFGTFIKNGKRNIGNNKTSRRKISMK